MNNVSDINKKQIVEDVLLMIIRRSRCTSDSINKAFEVYIKSVTVEAYHYTSKPVNSGVNGVGVRLPVNSECFTDGFTVKESINNGDVDLFDFAKNALSSTNLNSIIQNISNGGFLVSPLNVDSDFKFIDENINDKAQKALEVEYTSFVSGFLKYLFKFGLKLELQEDINSYSDRILASLNSKLDMLNHLDDSEDIKLIERKKSILAKDKLSLTELTKDFKLACVFMSSFVESFDVSYVESFIKNVRSHGEELNVHDVHVCMKQVLLPVDSLTKDSYVSLSPLHSMPFHYLFNRKCWDIKKAFGAKGTDAERKELLSVVSIDLDDVDPGTCLILGQMQLGGTKIQNISQFSQYSGVNGVLINNPPYSDVRKKALFKLANNGFYINKSIRSKIENLCRSVSIDYINGESGVAFQKVAYPNVCSLSDVILSSIKNTILNITSLGTYDKTNQTKFALMCWVPRERDREWYSTISGMICDQMKDCGVSSGGLSFIKKTLTKELSK